MADRTLFFPLMAGDNAIVPLKTQCPYMGTVGTNSFLIFSYCDLPMEIDLIQIKFINTIPFKRVYLPFITFSHMYTHMETVCYYTFLLHLFDTKDRTNLELQNQPAALYQVFRLSVCHYY